MKRIRGTSTIIRAISIIKSTFKRAGVLFMAISILSIVGCDSINEDTAANITGLLENKYGETFVVEKIGNRLNTDTVTAYCYAVNRKELIFEAIMNKDKETLTDNYIARIIGRQVEEILISAFSDHKVDIQGYVSIYSPTDMPTSPNIKLNDFIQNYSPQMFIANIILSDSVQNAESSTELRDSLNSVYSTLSTDLQCKVSVIAADKFTACSEWLKGEPNFNDTLIDQNYGIQKKFTVEVTAEGVKEIDNFYDHQ